MTDSQIQITFYQAEPVTEKQQPRQVYAAIFAGDETLISDEAEYDGMIARLKQFRDANGLNYPDEILLINQREECGEISFEESRDLRTKFETRKEVAA